jgi:hypothetical protein
MKCPGTGLRLKSCPCGFEAYCNRACQRAAWSEHEPLHHAAMDKAPLAGMPCESRALRALHYVCIKFEQSIVTLMRLYTLLEPEDEEQARQLARTAHDLAQRIHADVDSFARVMTEMLYRVFDDVPDVDPVALHRFIENRNAAPGYVTRVSLVAADYKEAKPRAADGTERPYLLGLIVAPTVEIYEERMKAVGLEPGTNYDERLRNAGFVVSDTTADNADPSFVRVIHVDKIATAASAAETKEEPSA